jgi:hypothetical protein
MNDLLSLPGIVEQAFNRAAESPDIRRWHSVSVMAGCAAVRMAADNKLFLAASLEGVAEEARRQMLAMMPKAVRA